MPTLAEILRAPGLGAVTLVDGARGVDRPVSSIALAERLADIPEAAPGALVLVGRGAVAEVASYRFDVALRRAAQTRVSALAIPAPAADQLSRSARSVASRVDLALLRVPEDHDLAELAAAVGAALLGDVHAAVALGTSGLAALEQARAVDGSPEAIVDALRNVLPEISLGEPAGPAPAEGVLGAPVLVDGRLEGWLRTPDPAGGAAAIAALLLRAAAGDVAAASARARRAEEAPVRSRTELLTELLTVEPGHGAALLRRARRLGLPVDAWHTAAVVDAGVPEGADEIHTFELRSAAERSALQTSRALGGIWHLARSEGSAVLVRTTAEDPGDRGVAATTIAAEHVVADLSARFGELSPRAGVGGVHLGPSGLRASVAEARTALASAKPGVAAVFDATGLRAMLAEWYVTDTARRSVTTLLEPLDRLGGRRADEAIRTLQAYLDEQGSASRTARRLHLHRNAVTYRVRKIYDALGIDPDDADARLALQLACRARLLS